MISMSSWSYFLSFSTALDGGRCWSMSIQFVVRLACMNADIGGVDFSSAAWLAVERRKKQPLYLAAMMRADSPGSGGWLQLSLVGWWRRGSGCGRGGWVDRRSATWVCGVHNKCPRAGDRRLVVSRLLVNLWGDWCQSKKTITKNDHKIKKTITKSQNEDHKKRSQNAITKNDHKILWSFVRPYFLSCNNRNRYFFQSIHGFWQKFALLLVRTNILLVA